MSIKPIKNEHDYEAALKRIEELFDAKQNTPEGDELEVLITLVSVFEDVHHNLEHQHRGNADHCQRFEVGARFP